MGHTGHMGCLGFRHSTLAAPPCPDLVPAGHQLSIRVAEEPPDVRPGEGQAGNSQRQKHWHRHPQVVPVGRVVAGPDRANALGAWGQKGGRLREDERPDGDLLEVLWTSRCS